MTIKGFIDLSVKKKELEIFKLFFDGILFDYSATVLLHFLSEGLKLCV